MYADGESLADRGGNAVGGNAQVVAHVGAHNAGQQQDFALNGAHNCNKASNTLVYSINAINQHRRDKTSIAHVR